MISNSTAAHKRYKASRLNTTPYTVNLFPV
jgi:hypothetical protein